jgi:hypothetical protein
VLLELTPNPPRTVLQIASSGPKSLANVQLQQTTSFSPPSASAIGSSPWNQRPVTPDYGQGIVTTRSFLCLKDKKSCRRGAEGGSSEVEDADGGADGEGTEVEVQEFIGWYS